MKYLEPSYEVELIEASDIVATSFGENDTEEINPFSLKNTPNGAENVLGLR